MKQIFAFLKHQVTSKKEYFLVLFVACSFFLGFPNMLLSFPPFILLGLGGIFYIAISYKQRKKVFLLSWLATSLGFFGALYWIMYPIHFTGGLSLFFSAICVFILSSYLAIYSGISAFMLAECAAIFFPHKKKYNLTQLLFLSVCYATLYTGGELVCAFLLTGFPWLTIGMAFVPFSFWIQSAHFFGSFGLTFFFVCSSSLFFSFFLASSNKAKIICLTIAFTLLFSNAFYGQNRIKDNINHTSPLPLYVFCVQGNIPIDQKWNQKSFSQTMQTYMQLSSKALQKGKNTGEKNFEAQKLLIWPETAMPYVFSEEVQLAAFLKNFIRSKEVYLAFGTLALQESERSFSLRNRIQVLSPTGKELNHYDKQHLVPFGEYLPLPIHFEFLDYIFQGVQFSSGKRSSPLLLPTSQDTFIDPKEKQRKELVIGPLICYEIIFSQLAQEQVANGANFLVTISNDAWFGDSSGPWQHLYLAALRAIEQKRPVVRATNSGISALIDAYGRITVHTSLFTEDYLEGFVYGETELTWYHQYAKSLEIFFVVVFASIFALLFLRYLLRNKYGRSSRYS